MHPTWSHTSEHAKRKDGPQGQNTNMFSPNVTMSKLTTGLEDKPLLPSVFRPNSTLYTNPLNVANTISGVKNPNVPAIQNSPSQCFSNNDVAYTGFNVPNVSVIRPPGPIVGTNIPVNILAPNGNLFMPTDGRAQNTIPLPGSGASGLVNTYTNTLEAYNNAPLLPYKRLPAHPFTFPNATDAFHDQLNQDLGNQNNTNPFLFGNEKPALPVKQVSPIQSNVVIDLNMADGRERFTDVLRSKDSFPYTTNVQANDLICNPSLAGNPMVEPREYTTDRYDRPSVESDSIIGLTEHSSEHDVHRRPFETSALADQREHFSDGGPRRQFFGAVKHSSDLRSSNSPLDSFGEENTILGSRSRDFTGGYREGSFSMEEDENYSTDSRNNVRSYLHDNDQGFPYLDASKARYLPGKSRDHHSSSPGYDKDISSGLYSKNSKSYEGKSVHVGNRKVHSRENRKHDSYNQVGKDSSQRLYRTSRNIPDSRNRPSKGRASDRQNYSRESSRARSRSHSPVQRHRSPSMSKTRKRTQNYGDSQERGKLSYEKRRSSPRRKDVSRHSPRKRNRKESLSPRRRSESASSERNVKNKRSDSRSSECTGKSETSKRSSVKRSSNTDDKEKTASRALKCFCLPEPYVERKFVYEQSSRYYQSSSSSQKSTSTGTDNVAKVHREFENVVLKTVAVEECVSNTVSTLDDSSQSQEEDRQYVSKLLSNNADDETTGVSSDSDVDLEGYDVIDVYDSESSDDDVVAMPSKKVERYKNQEHPRKLHPELWFNVEGELNHGKECLCSAKDKKKWIVHNVYPNEQLPKACEAMGNNGLQLYHYWVTVFPHPNFMTENPTTIESNGQTYTFEGFSLLSHSSLDAVPRCFLTRFNFKYEIFFIQEPIPNNFCIRDLELFSKFLFHDILEMHDWKIGRSEDSNDFCNLFHFLPRFTRKIGVSDDGCEKYELLSMRKVLEHLVKSHKPLMNEEVLAGDRGSWKDFVGSCVNSIVTRPGWKPSSIRIDDIERGRDKDEPVIVHHGIRPVQLSFSGDPKCQKLMRTYLKMRALITNKPDASEKERLQLIKMKLTLDNMKMKESLRRNCCVRVGIVGMIKTGMNSDVTQHALLLPVLVHHVRYHLSLQSFDEKIDYVFKDRSLLQLALTHPSYVMNYGTNPDHARNTLSNCGVKQPRYGDRRNRLSHTKKKGIVQLIDIMAKLEDLDGSQSFIQHNERLEFLGDAILEFICTCHLYFMFPDMAEGGLVTHRSSLVQNKHLAQVAKKLGLDNFMQFSHGPDLCHEEDMEHAMANCLEAILGAIYLDSDVSTVQKVFCKLAFDETELRKMWCSLPRHPLQEEQPEGDRQFIQSYDVLKGLVKLEEAVGFQFKHIRLLARSFTHPQVGFNNLTLGNNQRMELLGDSLVQWIVTDYLYRHFPEHHEGHLTLLRSSLVNRTIQAQVAGEIGLDQHVHFGAGPGVPKLRQKHMSDLFEAFLAAMFVDKGIEPVEVFCKVCLFPRLRNVIVNQEWMDAKSQLQSCCLTQSTRSDNVPVYKVLKNVGSPNMKLYTVGVYYNGKRLGTGFGDSIREAEMVAAQNALATNYFPEYARQKKVIHRKHKMDKRIKPQTK